MQRTTVLRTLMEYKDIAGVDSIMQHFSSGAFYSRGLNINTDLRDNNTTLHFAARFGHVKLVETLLKHRQIKCELQNDLGETALHLAASAKKVNPEILNRLIEKSPSTINCQNKNGQTPLHYAILTENSMHAITLLDNEADIFLQDYKGNNALHAAVLMGNSQLIRLISNKNPKILTQENHDGLSPLALACALGDLTAMKAVINSYQTIDKASLMKAASLAVQYGHLELLKELCFFPRIKDKPIVENKADMSELCALAAKHGHYSILKFIDSLDETIIDEVVAAHQLHEDSKATRIEQIAAPMNISIKKDHEALPSHKEFFPLLSVEAAAIILADKQEKTQHDVPTVVLNGFSEFSSFLETLKGATDTTKSFSVQFAIAEPHWRCGAINITNGNVEVCYIDPTGEKGFGNYLTKDLKKISEVFPDANLYVSSEKRQRDYSSCSVFTLDDMLHLLNAANYLPAKYSKEGIFAYFRDHIFKSGPVEENGPIVNYVTLPLRFIRTMQSLTSPANSKDSFFYEAGIFPRLQQSPYKEESELPVNKKGLTAEQSVKEHVEAVNEREVNRRIQYKLDRMRNAVIQYMHKHTDEEIDEAIFSMTLKGFLEKLPATIEKMNAANIEDKPSQQM